MLEVCVDSIESAIAAAAGGAKRLELCSSLRGGGFTPTPGFLKSVKKNVKQDIAVYVMLRPTADVVHSDLDLDIILDDIETFKINGADGFVFGALNADKSVDSDKCTAVVTACKPLPVTFHRAFDLCAEPLEALDTIIKLGFERILTSGMAVNAEKGAKLIKQLVIKANNKIVIMPGCGINRENIVDIAVMTGAKEFHASAKVDKNVTISNDKVLLGEYDNEPVYVTDQKLVEDILNGIKTIVE